MESNNQQQWNTSRSINPKVIRRGMSIFLGITIASLLGIFLYTNTGKTLEVWSQIQWPYILFSLLLLLIDLVVGGYRNHIFVKKISPATPFKASIKANLANVFMGAMTPSQSGGGPAQWYIYYRNGVAISDSVGVSFYNWISTIIFFPTAGVMALYVISDKMPEGFITQLTRLGFGAFLTMAVIILIGLFVPRLLELLVNTAIRSIHMIRKGWGAKLESIGDVLIDKLDFYRDKYLKFLKQNPFLMLYSFLLTVVLYFNKYVMAYVLVLSFGVQVDFWTVIAIQAVASLLLYFSPSPGASGVAEISQSALMATIIGSEYLTSFTLLFRSFSLFIPALLGSWIIIGQLRKETQI